MADDYSLPPPEALWFWSLWNLKKKKKIGAFHLERRESKPKARVRMNKDIEMNPKTDDSHPSTNEA